MQAMEEFLKSIERRAFRMAQLATHCEADAVDLVQEAMIRLVKKYSDRPREEWKPLFLRILENCILDWHRKEQLKKKLFFWKSDEEDERNDDDKANHFHHDPSDEIHGEQIGRHLLRQIEALPIKQQQCFLLRSWEGLSVAETSKVMGINESSVKTHYFRAIEKLRASQAEF